MFAQDGVNPLFARSLAAMEEASAQYRADRERTLSDDEQRQAAFAKMAEENRAKDEKTLAEIAEFKKSVGTAADPATSQQAEQAARLAAEKAKDGAIFQFEDDAPTGRLPAPGTPPFVAPDPVLPPAVTPPAPPPPVKARHRAERVDEDDDFSSTNWVNAD
ncbi:hypothetical protein [Amycolatopsis sp. H20-H5]|uniref:hypothetical protein n=1 Tax=Amycolatopsis sp. H20-H5 TaxID=3046309 RepID=UPI002DB569FE|nr:hypothetical protein [Amycolatopsis sp. H20-H5]MEC3980229.1 hypothetical protein [Amycolatopsis sp. H20-H5]